MRKASRKQSDGLRREYKRSDFRRLARGKYARRVTEATNVVVLDPQVAKALPNEALRGLIRDRKARSARTRRERRAG